MPGLSRISAWLDLSEEEKFLSLDKASRLDSIEIHAACQTAGVKLDLMVTRVDVAVDQLRDLLTKVIKDRKCHI